MSIFRNFLIGLDQAFNCLIRMDGEWGAPDETLSARAWRKRAAYPKTRVFIDLVFFLDREIRAGRLVKHCELAFETEQAQQHAPKEYRK